MKFFGFFFITVLSFCVFTGCSDSVPPVINYPLALSIVGDTAVNATLSEVFSLKVTKNGAPVSGATLIETDEAPPYYNVFKQSGLSDTSGKFPEFTVYYLDTVTEAAFQAMKDTVVNNVQDTLWSNTVLVEMP